MKRMSGYTCYMRGFTSLSHPDSHSPAESIFLFRLTATPSRPLLQLLGSGTDDPGYSDTEERKLL